MTKSRTPQQAVDAWNAAHHPAVPVEVTYVKDDFTVVNTVTRSRAEVLSGHTAVIWLVGVRGCVALERVKPR
jgi:hypothetical protein